MPDRIVIRVALLACAVVLASVGGCGSEFGATVTGKVTLDGAAVTPGLVTFASDRAGEAPAASDLASDGSYSLRTNGKPGAAPGTYRIAVQAFKSPEGLKPGERSMKPSEPLVPKKYLQIDTSGLEYAVERGSNVIDIALTRPGD
ncbi:MAG: hypothetical protein ACRCT8_08090 [Lacipirellulaceae bacterium]